MADTAGGPEADARLPVAGRGEVWRTVRALSHGHRGAVATVVVVGVAGAAVGLLVPVAIGRLTDAVARGTAGVDTWGWVSAVMVAATVAGAVATALTVRLGTQVYQRMLAELRERLLARALRLPQQVVERAGTGDLVSRGSDDVAQIGDAAAPLVPAATSAVFSAVAALVGLTALDPWYGLAFLTMLPVYLLALRWYLRTAPGVYRAERSAMSTRAQQILESARGHPTVAGFGLGPERHHRVLGASWTVVGPALRARTVQNMFLGRLFAAQYLGLGAVLVLGFWLIAAGTSTVGGVTAAALVLIRTFGPVTQLLLVFDTVQSVLASLGRIVGVIAAPGARTAGPEPSGGGISLSHVEFGYPGGPPVLHDIELTVPGGQRLGVVGASGAGKSTLAGLVAGIHQPRSGSVRAPARTAVITQECHVFAQTLRENLTLVAPSASDDRLRTALATTGTADLVELLPAGLDTVLGAHGHPLTPAQAQQLALARLLLADPVLAVLDEATAEAGSAHAEQLDRAAAAVLRGRTALVIAHRLDQAAACDRVVVLERGRVVESGTHPELLAAGGRYARSWEAWRSRTGPAGTEVAVTSRGRCRP